MLNKSRSALVLSRLMFMVSPYVLSLCCTVRITAVHFFFFMMIMSTVCIVSLFSLSEKGKSDAF